MAAIVAYHAPLGGQSVGKDPLVTSFLHGVMRLRPQIRSRVPPWDLVVVCNATSAWRHTRRELKQTVLITLHPLTEKSEMVT